MPPTERARQIDKEEFAAECAAIRQRAYARLGLKPQQDKRVERWLRRNVSATRFNRSVPPASLRKPAVMHEAFGKAQSMDQWADEYGIAKGTVRTRLKLGWTLEQALSTPPGNTGKRAHRPKPGVVSIFEPSEGTSAGSTAQETPNITFSGNDA
jgi:hypothetical protein